MKWVTCVVQSQVCLVCGRSTRWCAGLAFFSAHSYVLVLWKLSVLSKDSVLFSFQAFFRKDFPKQSCSLSGIIGR